MKKFAKFMIKTFNYFCQSLFIYLFFLIGRVFGLSMSRTIFAFLFSKIGPFFKSKNIINNNLDVILKKNLSLDRKKIINQMWKNYGKTFIEYVFLSNFRKRNSHIQITGEENLKQVTNNGNQVIFVSGHFANFELMSMEITKKNIPLATIYRPLNNFFLNPFMEYLRKKYVCQNQIRKGINGLRETIEYIKKKHCIALMIDQRVSEGEKIVFFDKPALTTTLPAQLSTKFGLDIIPVYIERDENNNFLIEFQQSISPHKFDNRIELTKKLNKVLEEMIIRNPYQWIWTHNRWK